MSQALIEEIQEEDLIDMYRKANSNLVNYRKILLQTPDDDVDPAFFHFDWSKRILEGNGNEAIEGFRESAKGQYVLRSFPLYCLTFPSRERDYIVLIKNNATLAGNKLLELISEYKSNPVISANCKEILVESSNVFSVDVETPQGEIINVRIEAYGKGASIRGLANQDRRPKIVILDDPQDLEDAKSDTTLEKDWDWFLSDIKFLGQHMRIFLIGNNLGEKCIIERVVSNAESLNFNFSRIPALINGASAWPAKYPTEEILAEKEAFRKMGKLEIWLREKMCESTPEEGRIFKKEDYRYFPEISIPRLMKSCHFSMTLDPASSKNRESCYRAFVVNAVDKDGNWLIVDIPFGRWDSHQLMNVMFDKVVQWKLREVGIEKGMFHQVIEPFIYEEMSRRDIRFNIVELEHAQLGTKLERIKMLQPRFKSHQIFFLDAAPWLAELESELAGVTNNDIKSLFIDLVDALAMQQQIAKKPFLGPDPGITEFSKHQYDPLDESPRNQPRTINDYHSIT